MKLLFLPWIDEWETAGRSLVPRPGSVDCREHHGVHDGFEIGIVRIIRIDIELEHMQHGVMVTEVLPG